MTSKEKIAEAERFLQKLINSYEDEIEVKDNFSAFLSASRSIMEHLLEEYNQKYGTKIEEWKDIRSEFKKLSKTNTKVRKFIDYVSGKEKATAQNDIYKLLSKKRNLNIHRETTKPLFMITIITNDPSYPSIIYTPTNEMNLDRVKKELLPFHFNVRLGYDANGKRSSKPIEINQSIFWYLYELPQWDLKELCKLFLNFIKEFVSDIQREFS